MMSGRGESGEEIDGISESRRRYPDFGGIYLADARRSILEFLQEKIWIRAGLERKVWIATGVFPSIVGMAIRELQNEKRCVVEPGRGTRLHIVRLPNQEPTSDYIAKVRRIDRHLNDEANHADVPEVLTSLALFLVREELGDNFRIVVYPDYKWGGRQFDAYIQYSSVGIAAEVRNRVADTAESGVAKFLKKCEFINAKPMIISTWMTREAMTHIVRSNGFFCNLCRIFTAPAYPSIRNDFAEEGYDKIVTFVDFTRWGWSNARDAKKWVNERVSRGQIVQIVERAREVLNSSRGTRFMLAKIRGIVTYAILKIHVEQLLSFERDISRLGHRSLSKKVMEQLTYIPRVYLNLLFSNTPRTTSKITEALSRSNYLKKQRVAFRQKFIEDILKWLGSRSLIKRSNSRWFCSGMESPYITRSAIFADEQSK